MGHARRAPQKEAPLELTLLANGGAELTRNTVQVWASDSDDEFADEFGEEFLDENDTEAILNYLVEADFLTDAEADDVDVFVESAEAVGHPSDELEDDAEDIE